MNRRQVIAGAGGVLAAGMASGLLKNSGVAFAAGEMSLLSELSLCIERGYTCEAHCMKELSSGNKDMGKCNIKVNDMLAVCQAMQRLVAYKSDRAKDMAAVCIKACQDCADACEEHKAHWAHKMHLDCKACFDSCVAVVKAVKKTYG